MHFPDHSSDDSVRESTAELAARALAGDQEKFLRLYERVAPTLYAWAHLRISGALRRGLDPEELMQEVWLRALRNARSFGETGSSFRGWILGIARNVLLEALRRLHPAANPSADDSFTGKLFALDQCPDSITTITTRLSRDEGLRRFLDYVEGMEQEDRRILVHCGLEELTCAETATRLGLTLDATTKRWQRLRERLRDSGVGRQLLLSGID